MGGFLPYRWYFHSFPGEWFCLWPSCNMISQRAKGHLATFFAAVLFGLMSPVSKLVMGQGVIDGYALAAMRICGAAMLFWGASFVARDKQGINWRKDGFSLLGMSLCGMALNQFFYIVGVQYTAPTNACVIGTGVPVMALLLSAVFLGLRITWAKGVGVMLASIGAVVLVSGSAAGDAATGSVAGDAMVFISQVFAAFYFVFFGRVIAKYRMITLLKWLFTLSAIPVLCIYSTHLIQLPWGELTFVSAAGTAYVVCIGTFVCYFLLMSGQKRLTPPVVATYNYVQPVVAALLGICWGLEVLTWQKCLALVLVAVGVRCVSKPKS